MSIYLKLKMHHIGYLLILIATILKVSESTTKDLASKQVPVNKCCARNEVVLDNSCTHINESDTTAWSPIFTSDDGTNNVQVDFRLVIGEPDCGSTQQWPVLHYQRSIDRLILLPSGKLRHCVYHAVPDENDFDVKPLDEELDRCYDYESGKYCLDKTVSTENNLFSQYALVCAPEFVNDWKNTDFLVKKILDPVFRGIAMICFLIVAIVYFILPTVRDLVGNIISTISICMIVSQAADMVRIFTELSSHVSFKIAEIICYTSLLGAFFWLNSLGYYIWRTFKSRNVFLRVTDGKKYCYYSAYAWTSTILMGVIAVLAHFALEIPKSRTSISMLHNPEVFGPLGITIYFTPVAFTILVNIFFYATTLQIINRMNTYGRIHHKLKHSFRMFLLVFIIMTVTWLFMLLSWLNFDGLVHCYIFVNALQAPLFLYVCVFNQKHVLFLLRKSCCYTNCICTCCRPEPECEWGDEMSAMNSGIY